MKEGEKRVLELLERRSEKLTIKALDFKKRMELASHPGEIAGLKSLWETAEEDLALALSHVELAKKVFK